MWGRIRSLCPPHQPYGSSLPASAHSVRTAHRRQMSRMALALVPRSGNHDRPGYSLHRASACHAGRFTNSPATPSLPRRNDRTRLLQTTSEGAAALHAGRGDTPKGGDRPSGGLGLDQLDDVVGDVEIGIHVLHVVVVLEGVD